MLHVDYLIAINMVCNRINRVQIVPIVESITGSSWKICVQSIIVHPNNHLNPG